MIHTLLKWDQHVFLWVNRSLSTPFLDQVMPIVHEKLTWIPLYILLLIFMPWRFKLKGIFFLLILIALVAASDLVSAHVIKPSFHRLRPCQNHFLDAMIARRISCGSGYSFVSSHASNHFAIGIFLALGLKEFISWLWMPAVFWAGSIAFAQVYLGLHFPLDVIMGAFVGSGLAWLFFLMGNRLNLLPRRFTAASQEDLATQ